MSATTISINPHRTRGQRLMYVARRLAIGLGGAMAGIRTRWHAFVESGQLGPSAYQDVSRRTGSRF